MEEPTASEVAASLRDIEGSLSDIASSMADERGPWAIFFQDQSGLVLAALAFAFTVYTYFRGRTIERRLQEKVEKQTKFEMTSQLFLEWDSAELIKSRNLASRYLEKQAQDSTSLKSIYDKLPIVVVNPTTGDETAWSEFSIVLHFLEKVAHLKLEGRLDEQLLSAFGDKEFKYWAVELSRLIEKSPDGWASDFEVIKQLT